MGTVNTGHRQKQLARWLNRTGSSMLRFALLTLALNALASASRIRIDTSIAAFTVDEKYVSVTIDTSTFQRLNLQDPTMVLLARALAPAVLRVGGTQADYQVHAFGRFIDFDCKQPPSPMTSWRCRVVTEADWRALLNFTSESGLQLVYGLSDLFGRPTKKSAGQKDGPMCDGGVCPPRNHSNVEAFLRWNLDNTQSAPILGYELGNELNSYFNGTGGAQTQAADFTALKQLMSAMGYGSKTHPMPMLIGPDTHSNAEFTESGLEWFQTFVRETSGVVDAYTFHMYSLGNGPKLNASALNASFLSAKELDISGQGAQVLALHNVSDGSALWAGETASANNGGQSDITDTYIDGFWYMDQLGSLAATGVKVFCRQTLESSKGYPLLENYVPLPDYWIALLWSRIMGTKVLSTSSDSKSVRTYAHCGKNGGVTLAWINIGSASDTLQLDETLQQSGGYVLYTLETAQPVPGAVNPLQSKGVKLNGVLIELLPGPAIPSLEGVHGSSFPVVVPASSYGFLELPKTIVAAC